MTDRWKHSKLLNRFVASVVETQVLTTIKARGEMVFRKSHGTERHNNNVFADITARRVFHLVIKCVLDIEADPRSPNRRRPDHKINRYLYIETA